MSILEGQRTLFVTYCVLDLQLCPVKNSEWEKIIANEATDKQLISKIYKHFYSSTPEK